MKLTRIGAVIFGIATALHLVRAFFFPNLASYVTPLISTIIALITGVMSVFYIRTKDSVKFKGAFDMLSYDISVGVLILAFFVHLARVLSGSNVLEILPVWTSYFAIPITGALAYWNWTR